MWWLTLLLLGGMQGAMANSPAAASVDAGDGMRTIGDDDAASDYEATAEDIAAAPAQPSDISLVSETRRGEMRCAMLANLVMSEVARGVSKKNHGLTGAKAETLAGRLAEAIMDETGLNAEAVRALYKQDFEDFSREAMMGGTADNKAAQAAFDTVIGQCQPLYATIDLSGGGDGVVRGLAPVSRIAAVELPGPDQCYALLTAIASGMPEGSAERTEFDTMVNRLEPRILGDADKSSAEGKARLAAATAALDIAAVDALDEAQAEAQISHCFGLVA